MFLIILLLMCGVASADVYVVTAPDKSVYAISEQNDIVVPSGYTTNVIKNRKISDLTVTPGEERLYDFNGSKFMLNAKKVADQKKAEQDVLVEVAKKSADRASGIDKLKGLGLTDDEIKALGL